MSCTACTEPQCLYKGAIYLLLFNEIRTFETKKAQIRSIMVINVQNYTSSSF